LNHPNRPTVDQDYLHVLRVEPLAMELLLQLVVPRSPGRLDGIAQRPTMQVVQKVPVVGRRRSKLEFAHRRPSRANARYHRLPHRENMMRRPTVNTSEPPAREARFPEQKLHLATRKLRKPALEPISRWHARSPDQRTRTG
jgi:hypothetical protein